jgi:thioredoxin-like negative regulator of GroEL
MYSLIKIISNKCTPCKILEEDISEITDTFNFLTINSIEISDSIKEKYNIDKVPLLILMEDNKEISRLQSSDINKVMVWLKLNLISNDDF